MHSLQKRFIFLLVKIAQNASLRPNKMNLVTLYSANTLGKPYKKRFNFRTSLNGFFSMWSVIFYYVMALFRVKMAEKSIPGGQTQIKENQKPYM